MIISQSLIAAEGYYIHQVDTTVYSIEELAYICMYKGYALDSDFACKKLVQWIDEQCGCEDLAFRLSAALKEKGEEEAFVENILRFVGYVSEGEISRIIKDISEGLGLSGYERKKQDADLLYRQKRYVQAAAAYEELLEVLPDGEIGLRAACYYNLAAARAQMFLYEQALDALEGFLSVGACRGDAFCVADSGQTALSGKEISGDDQRQGRSLSIISEVGGEDEGD